MRPAHDAGGTSAESSGAPPHPTDRSADDEDDKVNASEPATSRSHRADALRGRAPRGLRSISEELSIPRRLLEHVSDLVVVPVRPLEASPHPAKYAAGLPTALVRLAGTEDIGDPFAGTGRLAEETQLAVKLNDLDPRWVSRLRELVARFGGVATSVAAAKIPWSVNTGIFSPPYYPRTDRRRLAGHDDARRGAVVGFRTGYGCATEGFIGDPAGVDGIVNYRAAMRPTFAGLWHRAQRLIVVVKNWTRGEVELRLDLDTILTAQEAGWVCTARHGWEPTPSLWARFNHARGIGVSVEDVLVFERRGVGPARRSGYHGAVILHEQTGPAARGAGEDGRPPLIAAEVTWPGHERRKENETMDASDVNSNDPRRHAEEGMRWLLAAALNKLRQLFGNRLSADELLAAARRAVEGIYLEATGPSWDLALFCTIEQAHRVQRLRQAVRIAGTIAELTSPQVLRVDDGGRPREVESVCVRITDATGQSMWSLDVMGTDLVDRLHGRWRAGGATEFLAVPIALPVAVFGKKSVFRLDETRQNFFLHLLDLRASTSAFDLLAATTTERARAEELRDDLQRRGVPPIDFMFETLVGLLRVVGLESFPLLAKLMNFTSYQATSCGHIDHASARLHGIVPGPPGVGKKLLQLAAKIQNPVCVEVSPTKVSAAGLVGASHNTANGWVSSAGAVARASGGVVLLQDAHGWRPSIVRQLAPTLQEIMEDGVVRDSVAGGVVREADAALLIDLNRTRHLGSGGPTSGTEAALLGVRPVLSRADLLGDIPADAERAWAVGRSMCEAVGSGRVKLESSIEVRELRLLVALLRDRHPQVDLGGVRQDLGNAYDRIYEANRAFIRSTPEAGDLPVRLTISFARFISAIARSHDRRAAEPSDVDEAASFVNMKLDFLKMVAAEPPVRPTGRAEPAEWVARHAGTTVPTQQIVDEYQRDTGATVSERTVRRAVQDAGGRWVGKGVWALPPHKEDGTSGHADTGTSGAGAPEGEPS